MWSHHTLSSLHKLGEVITCLALVLQDFVACVLLIFWTYTLTQVWVRWSWVELWAPEYVIVHTLSSRLQKSWFFQDSHLNIVLLIPQQLYPPF